MKGASSKSGLGFHHHKQPFKMFGSVVSMVFPKPFTVYTSVDPKQLTVNKFRLKPVILISECFCSRCGHTNHPPPPTSRETTGDNGRQRETRPLQSPRRRPHQPTPTPHIKGDNGRQRETRPLQSPRRRPHQPTPTPHMKGDNRRQRETTGDKTTSQPKKPTTPTNTKAARSKVALRTPTVNCLRN